MIGLLGTLFDGCALPDLGRRSISSALSPTEGADTALGRAIALRAQAHPGKTGIHVLRNPLEAFAARVRLARAAQKTLDVQYYIWRGDTTGTLLLRELQAAAQRGVRVRLLLDDNGTTGLDTELAALNGHANIEIRLFNPFMIRKPKPIGFLTDFPRANRRMHNKSFTADSQATIIGGRNVGNRYFGAAKGVELADLDVLAVGSVVCDVFADFDRYWSSHSSYPAQLILPKVGPAQLQAVNESAARLVSTPAATKYLQTISQSDFITDLLRGTLSFEWADTRMVSDDPAKGLGKAKAEGLLIQQLREILGEPMSHIELVSPYFVPTAAGTEAFVRMAERGVKIRVLTNSLAATNVAAVHAGYAKRRKDLLRAGVSLYEMRRTSPDTDPKEGLGRFGSSSSSLHAKTFAVDGARVFVGSFNFDPRSAELNTELGFVIESPDMARTIEAAFDSTIPANSYEVLLSKSGKLYWLEQWEGQPVRHDTEPQTTFWKRASVACISILPIEWML